MRASPLIVVSSTAIRPSLNAHRAPCLFARFLQHQILTVQPHMGLSRHRLDKALEREAGLLTYLDVLPDLLGRLIGLDLDARLQAQAKGGSSITHVRPPMSQSRLI